MHKDIKKILFVHDSYVSSSDKDHWILRDRNCLGIFFKDTRAIKRKRAGLI